MSHPSPSSSSPSAAPVDVLIVGAGPAGLALACALDDVGLSSTVVDRQSEAQLAAPPPDGRDIALTHRAMDYMQHLGLWARLQSREVAPLREAHVYNGHDREPLRLDARHSDKDRLGCLVPNFEIRRASFEAVRARPGITLLAGATVTGLDTRGAHASITVQQDGTDGTRTLTGSLVVAADSRLSETRRRAGIGAQMRDFGRTVIVCRMRHSAPHHAVAQECFLGAHTLAVLPMNGGQSSLVVTLPSDEAQAMMQWPAATFEGWIQQQLGARLGDMQLLGLRHAYPLVAVYAQRFVAPRFALIGDAAVGMHPVTAHGYNFGLYGVEALTTCLQQAHQQGRDIGSLGVLLPFESTHQRATRPIYHGTNAIVGLFTDDRLPAQRLRSVVIHLARHLPPLQAAITQRLTDVRSGFHLPPLPWPLPGMHR
jgi:ubiquinone biosynthesis UbiH/UbiF/VisC/COQ6 family hydroxylase